VCLYTLRMPQASSAMKYAWTVTNRSVACAVVNPRPSKGHSRALRGTAGTMRYYAVLCGTT
jgi:hypothetical protein